MSIEQDTSMDGARALMDDFADRTGLLPDSGNPPTRYLWTDAFALCNLLELLRLTGRGEYLELALRLVDQVHTILGRHRKDDRRTGWISGLSDAEGRMHPTIGGLRIGKTLNERRPEDPFDERLEWDRDGQYFHYLTRWMHALNQVTRATGDGIYNTWAIELAKRAHERFAYIPAGDGPKRMYWKMSIDLSYALVPSMGHHDPLDGFITYLQLQATAAGRGHETGGPELGKEISDMARICRGKQWTTQDPLGIGGLLADAFTLTQLIVHEKAGPGGLLEVLLEASLEGMESFMETNFLKLPAAYRLAFRELGLAIGLKAVEKLHRCVQGNPDLLPDKKALDLTIGGLREYSPLGETIERFWLDPGNREAETWTGHRDINTVMLATSLIPDGYLVIQRIVS